MNKRLFILTLLLVVSLLGTPLLVMAQEDELECTAFPDSSSDVRTSYYMGEGAGYFASGQLSSAIDSYTCVIEQIDGSYLPAYINRAVTYTERRTYEAAVEDYTRAIELAPNLSAAYNNRGIVYAAQQEYELALADFARVLDLDGNDVSGYNNRAVLYAIQGEFALAIADLEQAINTSGIDDIVAELTDPDRSPEAEDPEYDRDHAQSYALLGIVYSARALDNYQTYLLLTGSSGDQRIQSAAGALESRFTFELRLEDGTWLLTANFSSTDG